jgi:hypothetical protein
MQKESRTRALSGSPWRELRPKAAALRAAFSPRVQVFLFAGVVYAIAAPMQSTKVEPLDMFAYYL